MSRVIAITGKRVGVDHFGATSNTAPPPVNYVERLDPSDYINFTDVYNFAVATDNGAAHREFLDALMSAFWRARTWTGTIDFDGTAGGVHYLANDTFSTWTPRNLNGDIPTKEWDFAPQGPMALLYNTGTPNGFPNFTVAGTADGSPITMNGNLQIRLAYHDGAFYASVQVLIEAAPGLTIQAPKGGLVAQPGPNPNLFQSAGEVTVSPALRTGVAYDFVQDLYQIDDGAGNFPWSSIDATIEFHPASYWTNAKNDGSAPVWNSVTGAKLLPVAPNQAILPP